MRNPGGRTGPALVSLVCFLSLGLCLPSCSRREAQPGSQPASSVKAEPEPGATAEPARPYPARSLGDLPPLALPRLPEVLPGYAEIDPATGLHMTGSPVVLDLKTWRLGIVGKVAKPASLSYDELRALAGVSQKATIVCPGYFIDTAEWSGASLAEILRLVEPLPTATRLELVGADGYSSFVDLETARDTGFLAYSLGEGPLPVIHGFPLRAVFPGIAGARWVKWLVQIKLE